jgi:signal peptide peptidase SppA
VSSRSDFLAARLFNRPWAVSGDHAEVLVAALAAQIGGGSMRRPDGRLVPLRGRAELEDGDDHTSAKAWGDYKGYTVVGDVGVIPVRGTLMQRCGYMSPYSYWGTGYDALRTAFLGALVDPAVKGVLFDIDSPGGEVSGCFDFADTVYAARGMKPTWAVLNESAYSAAYAIASACDRITVPRTGGTGSVGVICMHTDFSAALEKAGISVTLITCGEHKADGSPMKPLSEGALERFQADVNNLGDMFIETVARNRNMKASDVRKTQALTYLGGNGVAVGYADDVMSPDAAFRALAASLK